MHVTSRGITWFGIVYLVIGLTWLTTIVKRNERFFPVSPTEESAVPARAGNQADQAGQEGGGSFSLREGVGQAWEAWRVFLRQSFQYAGLKDEMEKVLDVPRAHIQKWHIMFFWFFAVFELVCAFAYCLGGWALLRRYPFAGRWGLITLFLDVILKLQVISYMEHVAFPLQKLMGWNILVNYCLGVSGIFAHLSAYFVGLVFYQPYWFIYLALFFLYIFFTGYYLSRKEFRTLLRGR